MDDLRAALRSRFEADALLGARAIPLALRSAPSAPASLNPGARPTAPPGPVRSLTTDDPGALAERKAALALIDDSRVKSCTRCALCKTRTKTVFGQGAQAARIVFVGEAPGADEDRTGLAFVGRAGELLTAMIEKGMGLKRDEVFICNVLKCRPPDNRTPAADEIAACSPYLFEQLQIIQPDVIVALGGPAAQTLLNTREGITRLRGRFHDFFISGSSMIGDPTPLMPTFHPAYLLRSPGEKGKAWEDLKMVLTRLGLPIPQRK